MSNLNALQLEKESVGHFTAEGTSIIPDGNRFLTWPPTIIQLELVIDLSAHETKPYRKDLLADEKALQIAGQGLTVL